MSELSRLVVKVSADQLVLEPVETHRAPGLIWQWLARLFPPGPGDASDALRLTADADGLVVEHQPHPDMASQAQRFASRELARIRLRTLGREGRGLILELQVTSIDGARHLPLRFRVAGLVHEADVTRLGLELARALGLSHYRALAAPGPDVEAFHEAALGGQSPYRGRVAVLPVPATRAQLDALFESTGHPPRGLPDREPFLEPQRRVPPFDAQQTPTEWTDVERWEPGTRIETRRPGWSRRAAAALVALVYVPLALAAFVPGVLFGGCALATAPVLGLLVVSLALMLVGIDSTSVTDPAVTACFAGGAFIAAVWLGRRLLGFCRTGYRHRLEHGCDIDWATSDFVVVRGGSAARRVHFEDIDAVVVAGRDERFRVAVKAKWDYREVALWRGKAARQAARSAGVDIARHLDVPIRFE